MTVIVSDVESPEFEAGFQNSPEQITPLKMNVTGKIPDWVRGHLYRCAPSTMEIDNLTEEAKRENHGKDVFKISHWFDGVTQIHRFSILPDGSVEYMSRKTGVDYEDEIRRTGKAGITFGQRDPCKTFFARMFTFARMMIGQDAAGGAPNIGVTISPNFPLENPLVTNNDSTAGPKTLVAKTDAAIVQELDPVTLAPLRVLKYSDINKDIGGQVAAAHGNYDSDTREYFNFTFEFGPKTIFRAFKLSNDDPKGEVISKIEGAPVTYMHSFSLTDKYVVYPFWPYTVATFNFLWNLNFADSLKFDEKRPVLFVVVDRKSKKHVATYRHQSAFGFHTINAWDEGDDIVLDIPISDTAGGVYDLYVERPNYSSGWPSLHRYRLPNVSEAIKSGASAAPHILTSPIDNLEKVLPEANREQISTIGIELPRFHPRTHRKPYRYTYGISNTLTNPDLNQNLTDKEKNANSIFNALVKLDLATVPAKHLMWHEKGCFPGEPIFLPRPGAAGEDEGILVSVVLRGHMGKTRTPTSFLLILDAQDLSEIARAEMPESHVVPFGFHGNFHSNAAPSAVGEQ
ncbi:hypothetical protein HDU97_002981 [Phlyctochytrium planicorne]|nr:hypothetical protein HDU97_002981 [Phlyctochytrium planicorne]